MLLRAMILVGLLAAAGAAFADDPAPKLVPSPVPKPVVTPSPAERLDGFYLRLKAAKNPQAAASIVALIDEERLKAGSDTGKLLMARAAAAKAGRHDDIGLQILDELVALRPDWPVGWSRRALVRLEGGDASGAMADFAEALKRDPRDLQAMAGVAETLAGEKKFEAAEAVFQQALALAPAFEPLVEAEKRVKAAIVAHSL